MKSIFQFALRLATNTHLFGDLFYAVDCNVLLYRINIYISLSIQWFLFIYSCTWFGFRNEFPDYRLEYHEQREKFINCRLFGIKEETL